jgi:hypothetical protein
MADFITFRLAAETTKIWLGFWVLLSCVFWDKYAQAEMAGMAQADRAGHRPRENDPKRTAGPPPAIVVRFVAKALELNGPELLPANTVGEPFTLDFVDFWQFRSAFAEASELLPQHMTGKLLRCGIILRLVLFAAAPFRIACNDKRRGRNPTCRLSK